MSDLIRLPAPCSIDSFITCDVNGYFKRSEGAGANRDAMRMTKGGRLSMRAMAAFMTDLNHAEDLAHAAFNQMEKKHGIRGEHPDKTAACENAGRACERVTRLLAWVAAMRPTYPVDIGLQVSLILKHSGPLGCISKEEHAALMAGAKALTNPPTNGQGVNRAA